MLLNTIIPPSIQADPNVYRGYRLIIIIDLVLISCTALFAPLFWWMGYYFGTYIMIYTMLNAIFFIGLMYYTLNLTLCSNFFSLQSWLVFGALIYSSGGTDSPFFLWLLSIPPIAIFYMRNRFAHFWLALTLITVVGVFVVEMFGYNFPNHLPEAYEPFMALFNYTYLLLLFTAVAQSFKKIFRRINGKLTKSNLQLKRSNQELERFAFVASHDLKSPLRNVISFIRLFIRRHGQELATEPREYLKIAESSAVQMEQLIEDILEYSQTSNPVLREEEVDLNDQLRRICEQLMQDPAYTNAAIEFEPLPCVVADSVRIYQIFQNLVENGLKYNRSETAQVVVRYYDEGEVHHFVIEDNGIGIPQSFHERIFKMFERLHNQASFQGTGIGLAICLKNVQAYEGRIEIDSTEGEGSRFHLYFPKSELKVIQKHSEKTLSPANT